MLCCEDLLKGYLCVCLCNTNGGGGILILFEWAMVVERRCVLFEDEFTTTITQLCSISKLKNLCGLSINVPRCIP